MPKKITGRGGPGRGQGRKPLSEDEGALSCAVTIKLHERQRDKLQRLGGAPWVRARIDGARDPQD